jgi:peptide/nickel transport system substrate-binding protein
VARSTHWPTSLGTALARRGLFALPLLLSLSTCSRPDPSTAALTRTSLTIGTAIPRGRNPATGVAGIVNLLTLEAPISIGWDGRGGPRAIDRWEWSADGLTLRLRVRPGIVFHDGTVLTNTIAAEILKGTFKADAGAVSTTVTSITADGADEIVIRTAQPEGFLLSDISVADFSLPGKPQVGTGPFRLTSQPGGLDLAAFDQYRGGRPAIDAVHIATYTSQRQAWAAMMRDETDMLWDVSAESLAFVEAESTVKTYPFMRAYYDAMVFNLTLPLFARRDVRRALNAAVDRQQVVDDALGKLGVPADGPIWPYHFAHLAGQAAYRFDPQRAESQLDALGLKRSRPQPGRMPSRFRFTCLVSSEDHRLQRIALLIQKQLFNVGVEMLVDAKPLVEVQTSLGQGRFEAVLSEFGSLRSLSYAYSLWHSPAAGQEGLNLHYKSADAALDRLRAAFTEAQVRTAVAAVQRTFYDDPPAIFIEWMSRSRALRRDIEVPSEEQRDILGTIERWRPAGARPR